MIRTVWRHGDTENLPTKWFKLTAMERATSDFSPKKLIGKSAYGRVYRGKLRDGTPVAIKRFKHNAPDQLKEETIDAEFEVQRLISQDTHPNVRQVLAVSYDPEEPLIVYEYLPGGSLKEHLQGKRGDYLKNDAFARLNVAIDVASALSQLHYDSRYPIYHRDVKSANVLLDDDHRAKLADMGIAVVVKTKADKYPPMLAGAKGYKCPVYMETERLDDKSDVFSFGVLLMELVTCFSKKKKRFEVLKRFGGLLMQLATFLTEEMKLDALKRGGLDVVIEPGNVPGGRSLMRAMLLLAARCCSENLSSRPRIDEVADELRSMYNRHSAPLANQVYTPPERYQNTLHGLENLSLNQVPLRRGSSLEVTHNFNSSLQQYYHEAHVGGFRLVHR